MVCTQHEGRTQSSLEMMAWHNLPEDKKQYIDSTVGTLTRTRV